MATPTEQRVLVTGGTGFLGLRLVRTLVEAENSVRVAARHPSDLLLPGVEYCHVDLSNPEQDYASALAGRELVIHAAAMLHAATPEERVLQERVNVEATRCLVHAARRCGVSQFVYVSSTAAIPSGDRDRPADETFHFDLDAVDSTYGSTKRRAEQVVLEASAPEFSTTIVNPGFMFGPQNGGYRGWDVIQRVLRRRFVACTHGGLSTVHVDDVVKGICAATVLGRPGERYILSGENVSFREIARTVIRVSGRRNVILPIPDALRTVVRLYQSSRGRPVIGIDPRLAFQYYSSAKAKAELGFRPRAFSTIVVEALECAGALRGTDDHQ
jgi:dihydroflavonol-4-reductase